MMNEGKKEERNKRMRPEYQIVLFDIPFLFYLISIFDILFLPLLFRYSSFVIDIRHSFPSLFFRYSSFVIDIRHSFPSLLSRYSSFVIDIRYSFRIERGL
jgi:hypothetical protein